MSRTRRCRRRAYGGRVTRVDLRGLLRERMFRRLLAVRVVGQAARRDHPVGPGRIRAVLARESGLAGGRGRGLRAAAVALLGHRAFMGVFLDRWRRRQVLLWANLARAGMVVALIVITLAQANVVLLGLVVLLVLGTNRLILTALAASLPNTVPPDRLIAANAVAPVSGTVAAAVGAGLSVSAGAALRATRGTTAVLLGVAAIGLLLTAALSLRLPVALLGPHGDVVPETVREVLRELARGARVLHRRARLVGGVGSWHIGAPMASRSYWRSSPPRPCWRVETTRPPWAWSASRSPARGGRLPRRRADAADRKALGGRLVVGHRRVAGRGSGHPGLLSVTAVGFVAGASMLGFAGQSIKIDTDTVVALNIGDDTRGRVFSLLDVGINVALLAGIAVAGFAVPASGVSMLMSWVTGALLLLSAGLFLRSGRANRTTLSDVSGMISPATPS